jgi:aminoglycoside phosphotransferase
MDDQLQHAIMQLYPQTARIIDMHSFRSGYLPYPARLTLQTTTGATVVCVLKVDADADKLAYEALVLRALADLQLPVPQVIARPITIPSTPAPLTVMLISELPGQPLPWIGLTDLATADRTCHLVHAAVDRLHALTSAVAAHPIATQMPSRTLESEVQTIRARRSVWLDVPLFSDALNLVQTAIPQYRSPLVFSNGDYNPLNFLVADDALVGWIDFEYACFEDPYIGFAKFLLWADDIVGWGAGAKVGLVERFLYMRQVSPVAFLIRLVLRGLSHLQDTSPTDPPAYMLQVISNAVHRLEREFDA